MPYSLGSVIGIGFLTFLDMAEGSVIKLRTLNIPHWMERGHKVTSLEKLSEKKAYQ